MTLSRLTSFYPILLYIFQGMFAPLVPSGRNIALRAYEKVQERFSVLQMVEFG